MMSEHTPLPWIPIAGDLFDEGCILITTNQRIENDKIPIATVEIDFSEPMNSEQIANAALIVRSVNQSPLFDELVEALREAREHVQSVIDEWGEDSHADAVTTLATIDALLAKATS